MPNPVRDSPLAEPFPFAFVDNLKRQSSNDILFHLHSLSFDTEEKGIF